jgi:hypothetical protein
MRRQLWFLALISLVAIAPQALQGQPADANPEGLKPAQAASLVERALATEVTSANSTGHPMRYRLHKTSPRLTSTKEIVETRDGDVARLVAVNDQPLSPAAEQQEQDRLNALMADPSLQNHRKQGENHDTGIVLKLLHMLPKAFLYQYAGAGMGPHGKMEKFTFKPNPSFSPPDFETQALTALDGELWVDAAQQRVVRLEGYLQQDTNYGLGIVGKLDKGGWVVIEQADAGGGAWRIVHVQMRMNLRVFWKNRNIDTLEDMSQFSSVPPGMDYRQAIQMLRAAPEGAAQANR